MMWVQPIVLWGLLGVSIPLFIHLWNGKRGKVVDWAAFQWLGHQESESRRSVRPEQWLLLLIRMLFLATLVFFLAGMIWEGVKINREPKVIHLVWPDKQVEAEFRFELDQARKKGQQIRYLGPGLPDYQPMRDLDVKFLPIRLQDYLDELDNDLDSIYLYTGLVESFFPQARYWLPQTPVIRAAENFSFASRNPLIALESGGFLEMNKDGVLVRTATQMDSGKPVSGKFSYAFENMDEEKKASVRKALEAISEIYGLKFMEDNLNQAEMLFSDSLIEGSAGNQLVFLFGDQKKDTGSDQIVHLGGFKHQSREELLEKGLLPETVLYHLITGVGLTKSDQKISKSQLQHKFSPIPKSKLSKTANLNELLLALLLALFAIERYLSHRANL